MIGENMIPSKNKTNERTDINTGKKTNGTVGQSQSARARTATPASKSSGTEENQESQNTNTPTRPDIGGNESRINNMVIDFTDEAELQDGVDYTGTITDCHGWVSNAGNNLLRIDITLDDEVGLFESIHKVPLVKWSPLKPLMADLQSELGRKAQTMDLIKRHVTFSVKHNTGADGREYCNLEFINFITANEVDEDDNDTALNNLTDSIFDDEDEDEDY